MLPNEPKALKELKAPIWEPRQRWLCVPKQFVSALHGCSAASFAQVHVLPSSYTPQCGRGAPEVLQCLGSALLQEGPLAVLHPCVCFSHRCPHRFCNPRQL